MIGPALYLWMLAQQPVEPPSYAVSTGWLLSNQQAEVVMTIPDAPGRWQMPAFFERRGNQRCVLLYTFSTDEKNWERFELCSTPGTFASRHLDVALSCTGKGCEP